MSVSKEKRKRQENKSSGVSVKNAREEQNKQENKKVRTLAIVIAAVYIYDCNSSKCFTSVIYST